MNLGPRSFRYLVPLVALLASCSDDDESTPPIRTPAPAVVASWGRVEYQHFLSIPADLHLSPDGKLYIVRAPGSNPALIVTDRQGGDEVGFNTQGSPTAVTGNRSGTHLAVLCGSDRMVGVYSSDRQPVATWEVPALPGDAQKHLVAIAMDSRTNDVLVVDQSGGRIHRFRMDGTPLGIYRPDALQGLNQGVNARIAFLSSGEWLLMPNAYERPGIQLFRRSGELMGEWGAASSYPLRDEMVVGLDDRVYVKSGDRSVVRFSESGSFLGLAAVQPESPIIASISAMCADASGKLLVADQTWPVIHEFDASNHLLTSRFLARTAPDVIRNPVDLLAGPDGTVAAVDRDLRRVTISTPGGGVLSHWGSPETSIAPLIRPTAMARGADGSWYIYDTLLQRMLNYGDDGTLRHAREFTGSEVMVGGADWIYAGYYRQLDRHAVNAPPEAPWERMGLDDLPEGFLFYDIALGAGHVYLFNQFLRRMAITDPDGRLLEMLDLAALDFQSLDFAVDASGWLYFIGPESAYAVFDETGVLQARWDDTCAGCWASAIEVDADRYIYVALPNQGFRQLAPIH